MIIDSIVNAGRYESQHPLFAAAFDFIRHADFSQISEGKFDIRDGIKAILSYSQGKTKEESLKKFECHNRHIDIQLCIDGFETIYWKPRQNCATPNGEFNDEKDVQFFSDAPDTSFTLGSGQFAVFFPEDVHAPMIGEGMIRKLVLKIRID